jgi:hypothetical protein
MCDRMYVLFELVCCFFVKWNYAVRLMVEWNYVIFGRNFLAVNAATEMNRRLLEAIVPTNEKNQLPMFVETKQTFVKENNGYLR